MSTDEKMTVACNTLFEFCENEENCDDCPFNIEIDNCMVWRLKPLWKRWLARKEQEENE